MINNVSLNPIDKNKVCTFTANPLSSLYKVKVNAEKMVDKSALQHGLFSSNGDYGLQYFLKQDFNPEREIENKVEAFSADLAKILRAKKTNKNVIQALADRHKPESSSKLSVKDLEELSGGYLKNMIKQIKTKSKPNDNHIALTSVFTDGNVDVFLDFQTKIDDKNLPEFLTIASHEITHAYMALSGLRNKCFNPSTNKFFSIFEKSSRPPMKNLELYNTEINHENMLEWLGFSSFGELHRNFKNVLSSTFDKINVDGDFHLNSKSSQLEWKNFYSDLASFAKEEKIAYKTEKLNRILLSEDDKPISRELMPLYYEEMERFFEKKAKQQV